MYRVEDVVSGRMAPTFGLPLTFTVWLVLGALAELVGGLDRLHAAVTAPPPLLLLLPDGPAALVLPLLEPPLEPQAASVSAAARPAAANGRVLRMQSRLSSGERKPIAGMEML